MCLHSGLWDEPLFFLFLSFFRSPLTVLQVHRGLPLAHRGVGFLHDTVPFCLRTQGAMSQPPGAFYFILFPFLCHSLTAPLILTSPSCSSLATRHTPCPSPSAFLCDSTPPLALGQPPLPRLVLGRDATSPRVSFGMRRSTPHTQCRSLLQFLFWFVFIFFLFFFFLFSLTAPLLSQVHRSPSHLQTRVGVPSFLIHAAPLPLVYPFFFFFPTDHFRSLQVWNLLFTNARWSPPLFLNLLALRLSAHERGARCRSQLVRLSFSFSSFFHLLTNFSLFPAETLTPVYARKAHTLGAAGSAILTQTSVRRAACYGRTRFRPVHGSELPFRATLVRCAGAGAALSGRRRCRSNERETERRELKRENWGKA